jgi:hypothetical protein
MNRRLLHHDGPNLRGKILVNISELLKFEISILEDTAHLVSKSILTVGMKTHI